VALLLPDAERARGVERLMTQIFGLTHAEAALAALMLQGCSIPEAAGERGIAVKTARAQWQTVAWKIGTGSETPLVALLRLALVLPALECG
jgi:DNA-binding CsgD family transcriptional regulator